MEGTVILFITRLRLGLPGGIHPVHLVVLHLLGREHGLVVHDAAGDKQ